MDDTPSLSVTRPLTGFLPLWLAAWILPGCITVPAFMICIYLGDRYTSPGLYYAAMAVMLAQPVLLAVAHARLMRGWLRRPRLWGVMTGGGVAIAALATSVLLNLVEAIASGAWLWLGDLAILSYAVTYYAVAGFLFGLIAGLLQSTALGPPWQHRLGWCSVSIVGSLAAAASIWAWTEIDVLSNWADGIAGSLFQRGEWRQVPAITVWIAIAVLLHALPTGLAMRRLLRRRQQAEAEALVRRFD